MSTMKLELVPVPTADIERAKSFYIENVGFKLDHDVTPTEGVRVVQLTPPGSGCSILLSRGLAGVEMPAGALRGLHLVVEDIEATCAEMLSRGVETSEVQDMGGVLFSGFDDPDGNTWVLQQLGLR